MIKNTYQSIFYLNNNHNQYKVLSFVQYNSFLYQLQYYYDILKEFMNGYYLKLILPSQLK